MPLVSDISGVTEPAGKRMVDAGALLEVNDE
jgi:succinyl-CoA synthetase alpha subunit